jgi:hypothetical protein
MNQKRLVTIYQRLAISRMGERNMAADPEKDGLEEFDLTPGRDADTFSLVLTTKSEDFEMIVDRELLQALADEINAQLGKGTAAKT